MASLPVAASALTNPDTDSLAARLVDRAITRATGAPLITGNAVRILRDGAENYPAWLDAIAGATRSIRFEQYLIRDDSVGRRFADALLASAAAGVDVRLIYDWFGCLGTAGRRYWQRLSDGGVRVVVMAPPRLAEPFTWVRRDHRKTIVIDDRIAFVSGLCVADAWEGDSSAGIAPWRDTGLALEGPAVVPVARAFDALWCARTGEAPRAIAHVDVAGDVGVRVVASAPRGSGVFRLDSLVAAAASSRLWLSDAYFVGTAPYVQALRSAAKDGVDVRLLVPGAGDVPWLRPLSRSGYRPLLEAGVRVFEWNGAMLHAKTAVADGRWCRVGSTNLNLASWLGNWELDVAIEHEGVAATLESHFLEDLANTTEITLRRTRWGVRTTPLGTASAGPRGTYEETALAKDELSSSELSPDAPAVIRDVRGDKSLQWRILQGRVPAAVSRRAAAGALRLGNAMGAALFARRLLGPAEARVDLVLGLMALAIAVLAFAWPRVLTWPLMVLGVWVGLAALASAWRSYRRNRRDATRRDVP